MAVMIVAMIVMSSMMMMTAMMMMMMMMMIVHDGSLVYGQIVIAAVFLLISEVFCSQATIWLHPNAKTALLLTLLNLELRQLFSVAYLT